MGERPSIYVIAGVNGAGKSSIVGAHFVATGTPYYNPDVAAREYRHARPGTGVEEANIAAWNEGKRLLERAIDEGRDFVLETTLGGNTITALLERAAAEGFAVRIAFVGLDDVGLHLERVRMRVRRGGHDIPVHKIRERYDQAPRNLIRLLPHVTELRVFDNSAAGDPAEGVEPKPVEILYMAHGSIIRALSRDAVPGWAWASSMPPTTCGQELANRTRRNSDRMHPARCTPFSDRRLRIPPVPPPRELSLPPIPARHPRRSTSRG
ncbi:MAG TPA: zeta toxin family protein [Longimicrobium sp.]|uniref:zeta toxin family protein n=1 Tax=Longimicrobium sp. TaxID=2029185 RepID=UPI002EDB3346